MKKALLLFSILFLCCVVFAHNDDQASDFCFTQNLGQVDNKVQYYCKLHVGDLYLEQNKFVFDLYSSEDIDRLYKIRHKRKARKQYGNQPVKIRKHAYSMEFLGANLTPSILPSGKESFVKNYIKGNDPSKWVSGAASYEKLSYKELYPFIDMEIYSKDNSLKYDFIVKQGADFNKIKIAYDNVNELQIQDGMLIIKTSVEDVKELAPIAYQEIDGKISYVDCEFVLDGNEVSFKFPSDYDHNYDLIIDPTWIFSSLTGSTADNWGFTATYDDNENFYGGGIAFSIGYPTTPGAYDITFGGNTDAVITKFNPGGTALVYSTYIGGSNADQPHSLVADSDSNLVVLGVTSSNNFPTTAGAYDQTFNGGSNITEDGITYSNGTDIFVLRLNNTGAGLIGSTYLGGSANDGFSLDGNLKFNYADHARGEVVLDVNDEICIASSTNSNNFPTTLGSFSQTQLGGYDGIVAKLSPNLTNLNWSTYIGGSGGDAAFSIRVDDVNNSVFVCGGTTSNNLPASAGAVGTAYQGGTDGFISRFDNNNGALTALTYLGTGSYDQSYILEIDDDQDIYVVGQTKGAYPITPSTYNNPGAFQFIHKMDNNLTTTDFSTVFGSGSGSGVDISITAFLVDNCDNLYVGGWGGSTNNEGSTNNMPLTGDALQSTTDGSDFYFIVLDRDAQNLLYGSYFGSNGAAEHVDGGTSRFDKKGTIYEGVCAACGGGNFPTSPGAYSSTNGSTNCNFGAIKIGFDYQGVIANASPPPNQVLCGSPYNITFNAGTPAPPNNYWDFGDALGTATDDNTPTYTYADTGSYNVMYVAIDSSSCNIADTVYFNVDVTQNDSLDAQFTFPPYDPCTDSLTVQLDFTGSGADSLFWDLGDGTTYINDTSVTHTYTSNGTYVVTFEAYDLLCNNTFTLIDTVDFNPVTTNVTASVPSNIQLCSAPFTVNLTGNNPSPPQSYWDFGDGVGTDTAVNPMYTYADTGTYNVMYVVIDSSTCNIADTSYFSVTIELDTLNAQFNIPPYDPCTDSLTVQLDFTGSGADSLYWDMGDGSTYINDTSVMHTYTSNGTYIITFEGFNFSCNNTFILTDTVDFNPAITNINATIPSNVILCSAPYTINFTGNNPTPPNSYWDFGDGIGIDTAANPIYTYADTGTYNVMYVVIDSSTCNIADTGYFQITTHYNPLDAQFIFPPYDPCADSLTVQLDFTGSGADSLYWDMGNGTTFINDTSVTYTYTSSGTYIVTFQAYDFTCNDVVTITDTVFFTPNQTTVNAVAPPPIVMCSQPYEVNFTGNTPPSPDNFWDFGDGNTSTQSNPTHIYQSTGTYTVTYVAIDSSTCNIADSVTFNVDLIQGPTFSATLNFDPPKPCEVDSFDVELKFNGQNADSIYWNMGDGTQFYNIDSVYYLYLDAGTYNVSMTAYNYICNESQTISNEVTFVDIEDTEGIVPNVFTPNGDGWNDELVVTGIDLDEVFHIEIYNRWGTKVYEGSEGTSHWDGGGHESGVYFYQLTYTDLCSGENNLVTGYVTLLK